MTSASAMPNKVFLVVSGIVVAVLVGIVAIVISSIKKLNSDEVGIKYNDFQKTLAASPSYSGLHTGPPGYYFIIFPSVFRTQEFQSIQCLNKDGVEVSLSISYQYRVRPTALRDIIMQFTDYNTFKNILYSVGESAIHDSCSQFNTSQFQAERGVFQEDLRNRLVNKYNTISTEVTDMQVNDVRRPSLYEKAIRQKETAKEDIVVAENERPQKKTEADTKKRQAETQAEIILSKAQTDARILLNQANAEREGILNQYKEEAMTYKDLISSEGLGLDTEALLSYLGIRMIQNAKSPITAGIKAPAKFSYIP